MFSEYDPYIGVDFDKLCAADGVIDPQKIGHVDLLDSYTEFSQSGKGLHTIIRASCHQADAKRATWHRNVRPQAFLW